jgi:ATPase subunit of ABC transporter with duplicated ATPase domains
MSKTLYIASNSIGFRRGLKHVLKDISVTIHQGDKIALVGDNGSGKTTLLKIIANLIKPSRGKIEDFASVWYFPQLHLDMLNSDLSVSDYLSTLVEEWWDVLVKVENDFNWTIDPMSTISSLSGGELVKLHLGLIFYIKPQVLLLDEPTNHLDIEAKEWLIQGVTNYPYSVVIASHDASFADRVVNRVWELENGYIREFGGNVSFYRDQKRLENEAKLRRYEVALKDKKRLDQSLQLESRRQEKNIQTGIKARQDRSMSRMDRGYLKSKAEIRAGQKKTMYDSRLQENKDLLNDLEPQIRKTVQYKVNHTTRPNTDIILEIRDGVVQVNNNDLINNIRLSLNEGERIAILGANGTGKSQFLKMLAKKQLSSGNIDINSKTNIVYMDQNYNIVKPNLTILDNMRSYNPKVSLMTIRQKLREFLFWDDYQVNQLATNLSGGQVARLAFAMISLIPVDMLLLDEPTNNLDVSTQDAIIQGLLNYNGALIIVSHSLDFLERVKIDEVYCVSQQQLIQHPYKIQDNRFHDKLLTIIGKGIII